MRSTRVAHPRRLPSDTKYATLTPREIAVRLIEESRSKVCRGVVASVIVSIDSFDDLTQQTLNKGDQQKFRKSDSEMFISRVTHAVSNILDSHNHFVWTGARLVVIDGHTAVEIYSRI